MKVVFFRLKLKSIPVQWLPVLALSSLFIEAAVAQQAPFNTTVPGDIMTQFRNQRITWTTNVWVYANALFGILAVIEFAWSAAVMLLEKSDLQSWTSALVRKIMWIGAFYALLINGRIWIPAIIDSFTQIGAGAAGINGPLNPGDVFMQGIAIAGALLDAASSSAFFTNPGSSLALAFAALLIVVSYIVITINFLVTFVESYLVISVGFLFLGFGGSRWTAPYVERYIGLAVAIGIKIVLLYCLISAGLGLGNGWLAEAQGVGTAAHPSMTAFDVMGAALIFMMLCWQIPKLFSAVPRL
ncbi:MAG: P-type conjugative transfer protein TrbL [Acidobacteriota bacterium]|nr:P-type conjugative transfer protein TrbL [Acidobacteriota bacterium]